MTKQEDWLTPEADDIPATSERPSALGVWRCDGEQYEPAQFRTLIEATGEKPKTPDAIVAGGGELLAQSDNGVAVWVFTDVGMRRVEREMQAAIDRDSDTCLAVMLAVDLAEVGT